MRKTLAVLVVLLSATVALGQSRKANPPSKSPPGDVEIRLTNFSVANVPLKTIGGESESKEPLLMVQIEIRNTSKTKKADYSTWRGADFSVGKDFATAKDSLGNSLKRIGFGLGSMPIGGVERTESIYPGKTVSDVLVFETPVEGATTVEIELPAANVGGEGKLPFSLKLN